MAKRRLTVLLSSVAVAAALVLFGVVLIDRHPVDNTYDPLLGIPAELLHHLPVPNHIGQVMAALPR